MARLPQPGSDKGTWGTILNEYLAASHNTDGTLKSGIIDESHIATGAITASKLSSTLTLDQTKVVGLSTALTQINSTLDQKVNNSALSLAAKTGNFNDLLNKPQFPVGSTALTFLVGNSGADIPGFDRQIMGSWMARDTWANIAGAQWLKFNTAYVAWVAANPTKAVDLGVPLIPHDMDKTGANWNTLLDSAIAGDHDADYIGLGANLSDVTPTNGTLYARLWWEMNMSPIANNINRAKFIAAWNRAVPLIRSGFAARATATNRTQVIKIEFCPLSDGQDFTAFYPDSANVDIIGMDIYGQKYGSVIPSSADLDTMVNGYLTSLTTFANSKNKPMAMGEWGNWQTGTNGSTGSHGLADYPGYITMIFDWATANNVEYLCYFNISDGGVGLTMADTPNSLAVYQQRTAGISAGGTVHIATLNASTSKLDEAQVPTRLSTSALNAAYSPALVVTTTQTAAYTLVLTDGGKTIEFTNTSDTTLTVPPNSSVAFPIGTYIEIAQLGTGAITFNAGSGVTIRSRGNIYKTGGQYAVAGIRKRSTDEWILMGDITA